MSSVSDLYDLWLKAVHLPEGKAINVTIQTAAVKVLHPRPTEEKTALVLSFLGKNRKLILNDGNANRLVDITGTEDYTAWSGLVISLKRKKYTSTQDTIIIGPATNGNGHTK